ncbi:protein TRI1-like [Canna indica]|uniref:Protein TRI1-like n=1 Tax=Canna indica TaxID=4628 RepID=A0AAQ3K625_9LILI|nr:protein TRI1-like [Canna indica]
MAASISSGVLCASAFVTADHPLGRRLAGSVAFPLHRRAAPAPAVRAASSASSKPEAAAGSKPLRGITKPKPVSPAMQALVGVPEIPRTQALKLIWAYIKEHNLQDPEDKKIIVCDEKLKAIFGGRDRVGFLEIAGLISPHFLK